MKYVNGTVRRQDRLLDEARACKIRCHDVLGKLRMGSGSRSHRRCAAIGEHAYPPLLPIMIEQIPVNAEHGTLIPQLTCDPLQHLLERHRPHLIAHRLSLSF